MTKRMRSSVRFIRENKRVEKPQTTNENAADEMDLPSSVDAVNKIIRGMKDLGKHWKAGERGNVQGAAFDFAILFGERYQQQMERRFIEMVQLMSEQQ